MLLRVGAILILLFSVIYLPFLVSIFLALCFMAYFRLFFEAVLVLFISDLIFGVPQARFFYEPVVVFVFSVLAIFLVEFVKKKLKFYPNQR